MCGTCLIGSASDGPCKRSIVVGSAWRVLGLQHHSSRGREVERYVQPRRSEQLQVIQLNGLIYEAEQNRAQCLDNRNPLANEGTTWHPLLGPLESMSSTIFKARFIRSASGTFVPGTRAEYWSVTTQQGIVYTSRPAHACDFPTLPSNNRRD